MAQTMLIMTVISLTLTCNAFLDGAHCTMWTADLIMRVMPMAAAPVVTSLLLSTLEHKNKVICMFLAQQALAGI